MREKNTSVNFCYLSIKTNSFVIMNTKKRRPTDAGDDHNDADEKSIRLIMKISFVYLNCD